MRALVLLSGPIAVGKSSVASELESKHEFRRIKSSQFLFQKATDLGIEANRRGLQQLGDKLDRETDYRWIVDAVAHPMMQSAPEVLRWLLDSVRKERQVEHFRAIFGDAVLHVHLVAREDVLKARYESRLSGLSVPASQPSYAIAIDHPNEHAARRLNRIADLTIDLASESSARAALLIAERAAQWGSDA